MCAWLRNEVSSTEKLPHGQVPTVCPPGAYAWAVRLFAKHQKFLGK